jgi:hypothetical protein
MSAILSENQLTSRNRLNSCPKGYEKHERDDSFWVFGLECKDRQLSAIMQEVW